MHFSRFMSKSDSVAFILTLILLGYLYSTRTVNETTLSLVLVQVRSHFGFQACNKTADLMKRPYATKEA